MSLDQVILRAFLEGFDRQPLVVETAEDDESNVRGGDMRSADGIQALRVRQAEVEKDDVDFIFHQMLFRFLHQADVGHDDAVRGVLVEHLAKQPGVAVAVLDHQQVGRAVGSHGFHLARGSWAFSNQKSLMLRTTLSNLSSWTGLLR